MLKFFHQMICTYIAGHESVKKTSPGPAEGWQAMLVYKNSGLKKILELRVGKKTVMLLMIYKLSW